MCVCVVVEFFTWRELYQPVSFTGKKSGSQGAKVTLWRLQAALKPTLCTPFSLFPGCTAVALVLWDSSDDPRLISHYPMENRNKSTLKGKVWQMCTAFLFLFLKHMCMDYSCFQSWPIYKWIRCLSKLIRTRFTLSPENTFIFQTWNTIKFFFTK